MLTELTERETLKLMTLEYRIEDEGHFLSEPIIQLFCRDEDGARRMIEVEGFYPFFYVTEDEYQSNEHDLLQESKIRAIELREGVASDERSHNKALEQRQEAPRKTLEGERLVRIYTVVPSDVADLRGHFDETWEADVFFTNRFLIESGIKRGLTIPNEKDRVTFNQIEATEELFDLDPRMVTIDIEVWSGGKFPDTQNPAKPITAVTAHDNYDDEYIGGILRPWLDADRWNDHSWGDEEPEWELPDGIGPDEIEIRVFEDEAEMLGWVNNWMVEKDPDLLTGWNSSRNEIGSGFDYPYWINRCERINEWTYRDLSPTETTFVTERGSPVIGGRELFDMLQAYKKTQIHEKRSYSLGYIADDELGYGKEDIEDLDEGWLHNPVDFMKYNIRDVEAVVGIENAQNVLELYDNLRSLAGCTYSEAADSNIGIIDVLFLRQAKESGIALPTSTKPVRDWFYGGRVFTPTPGKHRNVVYPDLASLYPYLMWSLNVSPETMYESIEELEADGYTEDDAYWAHVDYRDDDEKRDSDPDTSVIYYLKPDVRSGFVRDVIDDMVDMKYEYKGNASKYEAVKRIANSIYGVFGDSSSYGKGFRLFDWRLAETVTIAGQMVLQYSAEEFIDCLHSMGYRQAELVGGDTDSFMTTIPSAETMEEAIEAATTAAMHVNQLYDDFMCSEFRICDPEAHKMEVEIESFAEALFFARDFKANDPDVGIKKRYSQLVTWDEGETIDDPDPKTKGFELVRSDTAEITEEVQREVLRLILEEDDPKDAVADYLKEKYDAIESGEVSLEMIGKPSNMTKDVWDYGWSVDDATGEINYYTPQPHIRGARYAEAFIDGEDVAGGKPLMFYVSGVHPKNGLPQVYSYENRLNAPDDDPVMVEGGRRVDAISLNDVRNMPDDILIDWEKMAVKTLRDPIEPIIRTMGWDFDDLITEGEQAEFADFM